MHRSRRRQGLRRKTERCRFSGAKRLIGLFCEQKKSLAAACRLAPLTTAVTLRLDIFEPAENEGSRDKRASDWPRVSYAPAHGATP